MEEQNTKNSGIQKLIKNISSSLTLKLGLIAFLILLLLIPLSMVQELIFERNQRKSDAYNEITEKWGRSQTIQCAVVTIPYIHYVENNDGSTSKVKRFIHLTPKELKIDGQLVSEIRKRGIYKAVVYDSDFNITGKFQFDDVSKWNIPEENILLNEIRLSLGLNDLRSIQNNVFVNWDNTTLEFEAGIPQSGLFKEGISVLVPIESIIDKKAFSIDLSFRGSENIQFIPLGSSTSVTMQSDWANPSFIGAFLPERTITKNGFDASWNVMHLNRPMPQSFKGNLPDISSYAFGVKLLLPVDDYQKNLRTAKYGILIITLTFLMFFFSQMFNKMTVHPLQFIIIGLTLCLFYSLLLSLSEIISFNYAYIISSIGIIGLIGIYAKYIFKNRKMAGIVASSLIVLYGYIFTLIQLQDHALLVGNIGLFLVMSLLMYLTRNINWLEQKEG